MAFCTMLQAKIACKVQRKGGEEAAPLALAVVMIAPWARQSIGGLNGRSTVAGAPPCKDDHFSQMKCLFCTAADKRPSRKFLSEAHSLFLLYLLDFDCSLCFPFSAVMQSQGQKSSNLHGGAPGPGARGAEPEGSLLRHRGSGGRSQQPARNIFGTALQEITKGKRVKSVSFFIVVTETTELR